MGSSGIELLLMGLMFGRIEGIEKIKRIEANQKQNDDVSEWSKSTALTSPQHGCFPVPRARFCQRKLPCDARNIMFACTLTDAGKLSLGLSMHETLLKATEIKFGAIRWKPIQASDSNPDSGKPRSGFNSETISQPNSCNHRFGQPLIREHM